MEVRPGYQQTEVGLIPRDWAVKPLGEFASVTAGGTPSRTVAQYWNGDIPWITTSEIDFYTITHAEQFITKEGLDNSAARLLPCGTLLMALYGQGKTRGKVGILGIEAATNQACAAISLKGDVSQEFLFHLLASQYDGIRNLSNTGNQENLNGALVRSIPILLPPLSEQRAIARALSDVDALLGGLDRLIAKKRDIKQAAMQLLLTGQTRLPGFYGEWVVKELGQLGSISGAGVDKKIRPGEPPVRLLNYMDVYRRNFIRSKDLDYVVSASPDQAARCAVRKGDIFFTPSSEMPFDIAASAVATEDIPDACYSYHVVRLRLDEDWDLSFRAYAFKTQAFLDQAARSSEGSGVRYVITQCRFRQLTIRYPSDKAEQTAIGAILSDMDVELAALEARRDKTRDLKQAMMQELLTGKTRLVPVGAAHA